MKKILSIFAILILLTPLAAMAQIVNCGNTGQQPCTLNDLIGPQGLIKIVIEFLLTKVVTTLALIFLIIGAGMMITSAGDPGKMDTGKKIVFAAIIGAFLAFGAWYIIGFVLELIGAKPEYIPK